MQRAQRHIKVPPEYFRKAKDEYTDWTTAWWREAIQNSLDAGASRLEISLKEREGGGVHVRFRDNGRGMNEEVLLNTFLALGGSKKEEGSIGGFGYAKNLLCFAHKHYRITTGYERIEGVGGDYEYWQDTDPVRGVILDVEIDDDLVNERRFRESLLALLNASRLPHNLDIQLDGEPVELNPPKLPFKVQTDIGELQFDDASFGPSKLWARMGGLAMFVVNVWTDDAHFRGVLDLKGRSLDMLTSNRDSLRSTYQDSLQKIVQQLATERGRLKCNDLLDLTLNFEAADIDDPADSVEDGSTAAPVPDGEPAAVIGALGSQHTSLMSPEQQRQAGQLRSDQGQEGTTRPAPGGSDAVNPFQRLATRQRSALDRVQERLSQLDTSGYPKTFRIRTAKLGAESRRDPAAAYTPIFKKLAQERIQKLARAWEATVRAVLSQPMATMQGVDWKRGRPYKDGRPINAGFVFSEELEGLHVPHPDKAFDILMNPDVMPRFDQEDMLDLALHEVTHLWVSGHHEGFTTMEAKLRRGMRKFMPLAELRKTVRQAIDHVPEKPAKAPTSAKHALDPSEGTPVVVDDAQGALIRDTSTETGWLLAWFDGNPEHQRLAGRTPVSGFIAEDILRGSPVDVVRGDETHAVAPGILVNINNQPGRLWQAPDAPADEMRPWLLYRKVHGVLDSSRIDQDSASEILNDRSITLYLSREEGERVVRRGPPTPERTSHHRVTVDGKPARLKPGQDGAPWELECSGQGLSLRAHLPEETARQLVAGEEIFLPRPDGGRYQVQPVATAEPQQNRGTAETDASSEKTEAPKPQSVRKDDQKPVRRPAPF